MEKIPVDLTGVSETLLGNLGRRAAAARLGALTDLLAIEVVDRLDFDFSDVARGVRLHAVRVATLDAAVRRFLGSHPAGTVVALGEGLETQFWRLDNGRVRWLTVDLPETMELRHQVAAFVAHRRLISLAERKDPVTAALGHEGPLAFGQRLFEHHEDDVVADRGARPARPPARVFA